MLHKPYHPFLESCCVLHNFFEVPLNNSFTKTITSFTYFYTLIIHYVLQLRQTSWMWHEKKEHWKCITCKKQWKWDTTRSCRPFIRCEVLNLVQTGLLSIIEEKCMEVWTTPNSNIICFTILMWAWPWRSTVKASDWSPVKDSDRGHISPLFGNLSFRYTWQGLKKAFRNLQNWRRR